MMWWKFGYCVSVWFFCMMKVSMFFYCVIFRLVNVCVCCICVNSVLVLKLLFSV